MNGNVRILGLIMVASVMITTFSSTHVNADDEQKRGDPTSQYNVGEDRLAIEGYDPVSYFDGQPKKGDKAITTEYEGIVYRFTSEANRDRFLAEPNHFKPAYGGWCATAMASGEKVAINPTNYKLVNGRLMLFYKSLLVNARNDWDKNEAKLLPEADAHWREISGESPPDTEQDAEQN